jgi:hypothetical protein
LLQTTSLTSKRATSTSSPRSRGQSADAASGGTAGMPLPRLVVVVAPARVHARVRNAMGRNGAVFFVVCCGASSHVSALGRTPRHVDTTDTIKQVPEKITVLTRHGVQRAKLPTLNRNITGGYRKQPQIQELQSFCMSTKRAQLCSFTDHPCNPRTSSDPHTAHAANCTQPIAAQHHTRGHGCGALECICAPFPLWATNTISCIGRCEGPQPDAAPAEKVFHARPRP